jgi:hypoxanthine phosphoribosyltransferase
MRPPSGAKRARSSRRFARFPSSSSKAEAALDAALVARRCARRLHSPRAVARALDRMAAALAPSLKDANPVVLAVMHGGAFAALELSRRFEFPHEFDYVHVTRYRGGVRGRRLAWRARPNNTLAGRSVLVVDDILDHGTTLQALQKALDRLGVAVQRTAVLVVKRRKRRGRAPHVDVSGLAVDDVYVFGSGMDYRGYWRELGGIYGIDGEPP